MKLEISNDVTHCATQHADAHFISTPTLNCEARQERNLVRRRGVLFYVMLVLILFDI